MLRPSLIPRSNRIARPKKEGRFFLEYQKISQGEGRIRQGFYGTSSCFVSSLKVFVRGRAESLNGKAISPEKAGDCVRIRPRVRLGKTHKRLKTMVARRDSNPGSCV